MEIPNEYKKSFFGALIILFVVVSIYFVVKVPSIIKSYDISPSRTEHVITVSGHGEVYASPDIAEIYFTLRSEGKTVKEAQDKVTKSEKKALDVLKANSVEDKDIKTENISFNPKYEYVYGETSLPCSEFGCPPRPGKNVVTGYEAYETINVKIRNIDDTGKITGELGTAGVSQLNGPNFAIDNEDDLKADARGKAIAEAKKKAQVLARDLGVSLGGVVSFNENGGNIYPVMYDSMSVVGMAKAESAPTPQVPQGENTISSDVTITYEIK